MSFQEKYRRNRDDGTEEATTERDLSDDAQWKKIQENTFTRWVNEHLKHANTAICSLEWDFCDGLRLISLVEVLARKKLPKHTNRPSFRSQKLENVYVALQFLEKEENIRIVNIDSTDIVDGKLKLILGLIWTLILHYSISLPTWELDNQAQEAENKTTPKQRLLKWIQNKTSELPVSNFTSDWNDGKAIGALVNSYSPALCPEWTEWQPEEATENATEAMTLADQWLGIPMLISPEELVNPNRDELSMMTYLSQYLNGQLVGEPVVEPKSKKGVNSMPLKEKNGDAYQNSEVPRGGDKANDQLGKSTIPVKVWGDGLDPTKIQAGIVTTFYIECLGSTPFNPKVEIFADQKGESRGLRRSTQLISHEIKSIGANTYAVSYAPAEEGSMQTINILQNDQHLAESPYTATILPGNSGPSVQIEGSCLNGTVPASLPTSFLVSMKNCSEDLLKAKVQGPDGEERPIQLQNMSPSETRATFVPDDCGKYLVTVLYDDKEVFPEPFFTQAKATGNASACKMDKEPLKSVRVGEQYSMLVDAKNCGEGKVTCRMAPTDSKCTKKDEPQVTVQDRGDGTYLIKYVVHKPGTYSNSIKFGGQCIPQGFYTMEALSENEYIDTKEYSPAYSTKPLKTKDSAEFEPVEIPNIVLPATGGHVTAEVTMPSQLKGVPMIEDNRDGTVTVKYEPKEEGLHELAVKYNGDHVKGSPYKFSVDSISSGFVTAYGPGLLTGITGEPCAFTVSTKNAGKGSSALRGGLALAIEGPSKAEINCHDNKDGTVSATFLPTAPGEYKVSVKFDEKHVKGSPFSVKVTGEGRKRNQISVGSQSEVSLPGKVKDAEVKALNASIKAPSGLEEPCFLKTLPDGHLGISFTPREVGEHLVSVKKMGNHIPSSPFKITVAAKEVGSAHKVKLTGNALKEGVTQKANEFTVDTRDAGYGGLSLSIEGPSKADIQSVENSDGTLGIKYTPTEPGYYIANLKFADHHVPGSPFTIKVTGDGSNQQRERIQRQREAAPQTSVGSDCRLTFKMPGVSAFDLGASISTPGGTVDSADIAEIEESLYAVTFTPKELGIHTISVKYQEMHIPGSPFQFTVGPLEGGGAHKVHVGGPGLERGEQNAKNEFNVWTREAGAGSLAISVEGPSKAEIDFNDRKDGSCNVSYKVKEAGEYRVGIKFNDKHVPDSPFSVYVTPVMGDARLMEVAQFPDQGSLVDKTCNFLILRNGAPYKGHIDCKVVSPSGKEDDCFMDRFDDDVHNVSFVPRENGIHSIHIKYEGIHIPGSPFRLRIGKDEGDPAAVTASGKGLEAAHSGQKMDFIVDTSNAGAGNLNVTIDGPTKVAMDCTEVEEGYKVRYTPLAAGDYYISLKYNGCHIAASPYKVRCSGDAIASQGTVQESSSVVVETVAKTPHHPVVHAPILPHFTSDASQVTSKGLGLKKAHLNRSNNFTVDAGTAGNNILYVGIYGPKNPCEEVSIKHTGYNNYQVHYTVRDRGDYLIIVKWGDELIPGAPFKVST